MHAHGHFLWRFPKESLIKRSLYPYFPKVYRTYLIYKMTDLFYNKKINL